VPIDYQKALGAVYEFQAYLNNSERIYNEVLNRGPESYENTTEWRNAERPINERLGLIEDIARAIDPDLGQRVRTTVRHVWPHRPQATVIEEIIGRLTLAGQHDAIFEPHGPQLDAVQLHPWVWQNALALWTSGHRRAAVQAAATAIFDVQLPAKLERGPDTKGGKDLAGQAFSTKDAEPGSSRLRLSRYDPDSRNWTSLHEGAMYLGQGAAQAIRNLTTHDLTELEEQRALEMLAALSLFARFVDEADVVTCLVSD
jgi:hypothetical protein